MWLGVGGWGSETATAVFVTTFAMLSFSCFLELCLIYRLHDGILGKESTS